MDTRIIILSDNRTDNPLLETEHGLSVYLEYNGSPGCYIYLGILGLSIMVVSKKCFFLCVFLHILPISSILSGNMVISQILFIILS